MSSAACSGFCEGKAISAYLVALVELFDVRVNRLGLGENHNVGILGLQVRAQTLRRAKEDQSVREVTRRACKELTFLSHALIPHTFHALSLTEPSALAGNGLRSLGKAVLCGNDASSGLTGSLALPFLATGFLVCSDSLWLEASTSESASTLRLGGMTVTGRVKGSRGGRCRGLEWQKEPSRR